ncbi:MAG: ArgE/DapE family deacylase [Caldilineaceae bacterium]
MDEKVIGERVERLAPALEAFLQRMVQTPSLPNAEGAVQALVAAKLEEVGLAVDVVPTRFAELAGHPAFSDDGFSPDQRVNVIGHWRATERTAAMAVPGHGSLLLNGHVDVVSPGDETRWSASPWSGLIRDGKLYGRGSCDMKAGVTAAIFAVAALKELGYQPAHDILVQSVIGEESGGVGALTTIVKGYRADAAIILEPTRMELCPVQAGALTFRLTVAGKATHAAMKNEGVSAIDKFMVLNQAINDLNSQRHARYHNPLYDDPTNVAPISIGTIRGGLWHSTVPEAVVAEGRCGVFPGESVAEVRALLAATIQQAAQADPWLAHHPPRLEWFEGQFEAAETEVNHPMLQQLMANHAQVHGAPPAIMGVPYGADMRLYTNHAHIPTVLYGPGDVRLAHAVDEYVPLAEVVAVTKAVALTIVSWCGGRMTGRQGDKQK